jgi:hypothetical protein
MKTSLWMVPLAAALLAGCGEKSSPPSGGSSGAATNAGAAGTSAADAPAGYLGAIAKGQQTATKTIDTAALNRAIQRFEVEQGRNPKDLDELVKEKYIPKIPEPPFGMKIVYDASAGTVKVVKQ